MAVPAKSVAAATPKLVGGMREVVQDLIAPDLRAVKTSIEALTQELRLRAESLSNEMKLRSDSVGKELKATREETRLQTDWCSKK